MLCYASWAVVGMLSSKLALGPSKAMKFLKHLLPQAHFLYVQNFQISTEFYWKLNAFQCFQGDKIFEGGIIITTLNWVKVSQPGRSTKCFPVFHCGGFFHNIFPEIHKFFLQSAFNWGCLDCQFEEQGRESRKAVGNAVWYRRHPTLWGELSETVRPTSETPAPNI